MHYLIYDLETFPNFFLCIASKENGDRLVVYLWNDKWYGQIEPFIHCLRMNTIRWIGVNSNSYDFKIMKFLRTKIKNDIINTSNKDIYELSNNLINNKSGYRNVSLDSIDLLEIIFNIPEKGKSLKLIGCDLKHPKLQDLPYHHTHILQEDEIPLMIEYCHNDVDITLKIFHALKERIDIRENILKVDKLNCLSSSDSGICNKYIKLWLDNLELNNSPISKDKKDEYTKRVNFSDALLKYEFLTPQLNRLVEALSHIWYTVDLSKKDTGDKDSVNLFFGIDKCFYKKRERKFADYFKKAWLSFKVFGLDIQMGIGGIHSKDDSGIFESDDKYTIIDVDIDSLYPTLNINLEIYAPHLSKDVNIKFKDERDTRLVLKKDKKNWLSQLLQKTKKLVLNSFCGKYLSPFSPLFHPLSNLKITLNGQLLILGLAERIHLLGGELLSLNTDGITAKIPNNLIGEYYNVVNTYMESVNFTGEYNVYQKYIRKDISNYIAITDKGAVKYKGMFVPQSENIKGDGAFSKAFDNPIITLATNAYFLQGIVPEEFILNYEKYGADLYDFCKSQKSDKSFTNELITTYKDRCEIEELQKSLRFFVSKTNSEIFKTKWEVNKKTGLLKKKYISLCAGYNTSLMLDYRDISKEINYDWYIKEVWKVIKQVEI